MIYNIFDRYSFDFIKRVLNDIENNCDEKKIIKLLIGNKNYFGDYREVSYEEGKNLAESNGMKYIETTPENIESFNETFLTFVKEIYEIKKEMTVEKKEKKEKNYCFIF